MVKYIPAKRTSKKETLQEQKKETKAIRHFHLEEKVDKRHRFKSTKQQREEIDINLQRRIENIHIETKTDIVNCYFKEIIELKRSTMSTILEKRFMNECYNLSQSLPQILANISDILKIAYTYLKEKSSRILVLDVLPYLLKDCREEFYPYLSQTIQEIFQHIDIEEVEYLERSFLFIAYALKYLEKTLIQHFEEFVILLQELCFNSKFQIIKKLASEALGYLFRKNRTLIQKAVCLIDIKQLSFSIYTSIQSLKGYLAANCYKVIEEVWKTNHQEFISEFYLTLINNITEIQHQSNKIMISLVEVFIDLKKRTKSLDQNILLELFKNHYRKVTTQIFNELIDFIESPNVIAYSLRIYNPEIEELIVSNKKIVNIMLNTINVIQLSEIVHIILQNPIQKRVPTYRLLMASTFSQLFQQKEESLQILIELDEIHCINQLTPDKLEKLYESDIFNLLLSSDNKINILSLCKLAQIVQFPSDIKTKIIEALQNRMFELNQFCIQQDQQIDYSQKQQQIKELSQQQLMITPEVELLYAEQNQDCKSIEDGIILKILSLKEIQQISLNRSIFNLFSRANLQTKEMIQNLNIVPLQILEIGLMSRKRQIRLICAQKLNQIEPSEQLELMIQIDLEKITLENERKVKGQIINLKNMISKTKNFQQIERFSFGLAFTKFLLVRSTIKELLSSVLSKCNIQTILSINLIEPYIYPTIQIDYLTKHCYLEIEDEQLDSSICFEEVFAPALLSTDFNNDIKKVLFTISINYLQNQMKQDKLCNSIDQYYKRRFGDKTSLFHLKMLKQSNNIDIFKHWLLKDDEGTQLVALNNIKVLELQKNYKEYSEVINEFFNSMEQLINGKTFKGEVVQFKLDMPEQLQFDYKIYALYSMYPKVFSKQKLHKKKHKNAAIQIRRNAVFEQLSNLDLQNELIELLMENHGLNKENISDVPIQIKIQYLKILKNIIEKFGYQINVEQLSVQIKIIRTLLNEAYQLKSQENITSLFKELWKVAIKRLCQIINKYHTEESYTIIIKQQLKEYLNDDGIREGFEKIVDDSRVQASGILKLLQNISKVQNYFGFLKENHELLLSRFFYLYDLQYTQQYKVGENDDGKLAYQLKKQIGNKITSQRNCIQLINSIFYSIFELPEPYSNLTIESELNELSNTIIQYYGESILQCLLQNIIQNTETQIKDLTIVFLIYTILYYRQTFSNEIMIKCLELFSQQISNQKLYDSQIHNHNLMGKLLNNCIKLVLSKIQIVPQELIENLFNSYSKLLISIKNLTTRGLIVDVIIDMSYKFKEQYPLKLEYIELLRDMNCRNQITEEIEFDKCLEACLQFQKVINEDLITTELILQNCFFLLTSSELSIRIAVLEIFKGYLKKNIKSQYIHDQFLPQMIELIKNNNEISVKGSLHLFEQYLQNSEIDSQTEQLLQNQPINMLDEKYNSKFTEFKIIFEHQDPEQNIFNLLFDIQLTKRIKALQLIEKRLSNIPSILINSISQILLPLLDFYIFYAGGEMNSHKHKLTEANKSHYQTLQQVAISIYGYICSHFDFNQRITIMQTLTKKLEKNMIESKLQLANALIKTITAIAINKDSNYDVIQLIKNKLQSNQSSKLQEYIQTYVSIEEEQNEKVIDFEFSYRNLIQQEKELAKAREIKDISNQFWNSVADITVDEITEWQERSNILLKQVYLPLKNLFLLDEKHRVQLSVALTELIVQLPPEIFMIELNRLVGRLCRLLKNKDNDQRDECRKCLLDLSKKIGPIFLKFIIIQMKGVLTQGFENHVLSYTLGLLIEQINEIGTIDSSLEEILEIFLDEVFGRLCSEKETEHLPKKTKEIKSKKGMNNFKLIGSLISFVNSLPKIIGIIDHYVTQYQISHNLQSKLKLVFEHLYLGLVINPSINNLVEVLYLMICETSHKVAEQLKQEHQLDFTYDQNKFKKLTKEQIMTIQLPSYGSQSIMQYMKQNKLKTSSTIIYGLVNYLSIKLLHYNIQNIEDSQLLQKMFSIVLDCLQHKDMITESVSVLSAIIRRFEWVNLFKKQLIDNAMQCLSQLTSTDEQFIRDTFILLKAILDSKLNEFTLHQQKTLIHFIDLYIESNEALECLRIIIHAVWLIPSIYDMIIKIRESMLQTTKKSQHICQSVYISFLIKYPLSSQVLQQHYDFILANLQYKYFTGRQAIYQCLQQIFQFFPEESVNKLSEISYFSLIVALVKEDVPLLKDQLNSVLNTLIQRTPQDKLMKYTLNSLTWMQSDKQKILLSGIESLRILKDCIKIYLTRFIEQSSQLIEKIHNNWNQWKNDIQARNIQKKNLKNSQWINEIEVVEVAEYPEYNDSLQSFLKLLNVIDEHQLINLYEQNTLCKLFKFVSYPNQETANEAIQLMIRSQKLTITKTTIITQQDHLINNFQKIIKYLFLVKFARNTIIINQELTHQFIFGYLEQLQTYGLNSLIETFFNHLTKLTSNLMAQQQKLNQGIINLIQFYQYLLDNNYKSNQIILESVLKIQTLKMDIPQIDQVIKQIEKQLGAQEFIKIYSVINQNLSKKRSNKKIEQKVMAINDPEQYHKIKQRKMKTKMIQKKQKLLLKRGKLPKE